MVVLVIWAMQAASLFVDAGWWGSFQWENSLIDPHYHNLLEDVISSRVFAAGRRIVYSCHVIVGVVVLSKEAK